MLNCHVILKQQVLDVCYDKIKNSGGNVLCSRMTLIITEEYWHK